MTDGRDEDYAGKGPGSRRAFREILTAAVEVDAVVFGVGIEKKVDRDVLTTLAERSGGQAYFPDDVSQLDTEYRRIIENLRRRWIISYASTNTAHDGEWRSVTIETKDQGVIVRSRGGYFAPGK